MEIKLHAPVLTADGHDAGRVDRLILDPGSGEVKAVVVHKGAILSRDVEVPLASLTIASGGQVRLTCSARELDELPEFHEANYTTTPPAGYQAPGQIYTHDIFWPKGYGYSPGASPIVNDVLDQEVGNEALRRGAIQTAVIREGDEVKSRDGEKVGEVHQLSFDPQSGDLTGLIVRKGFIFTSDVELPADYIASVGDHAVFLTLDAEEARATLRPWG